MQNNWLKRLRESDIYRSIFILFSGNGISQIIPLILFPVISRLYSPDDFGLLAILFSIHSIAILFATGQFELAIILPKEDENSIKLLRSGIAISSSISFLFLAFSLVFQKILHAYSSTEKLGFWLIPLTFTIFSTGLSNLIVGYCNRKKLYKKIITYNIILSFLTVSLKVILGFLKVKNGLVISFIIAQTISSGYFLYKGFFNDLSLRQLFLIKKEDFRYAKNYLNFPKFNLPLNFINTLASNLPFFIIAAYFSKFYTGQLSVALTLLFKVTTLYSNSAAQVLYQKIAFEKHNENKIGPIINNYLVRTIIPSGIFVLLFILLAPSLFSFILGDRWIIAARFSQIMAPWAFLVLLGGPLAFIPNIFDKQKTNMIICIFNLIFRTIGLLIGVLFNSVYLAIGLFALSSLLSITYQLVWYRGLIIRYDNKSK
jgi:O-antigen/teichoic acid export membrane protein